jgi:itaconate CoA-transferase
MQVLWHHPQLQARHRLTTVDTPAGPVAALRPPASHSSHAPRMAAVLALGEHTAAILAELGYTPQRCAQLRADGVV